MIEPREDEECATCAGFYEPLVDRRGVRVRLDREDRYFCAVCARLIAAAWQVAERGGRDG